MTTKTACRATNPAVLLGAASTIALLAAGGAMAQPITETSSGDITVDEPSASGTPRAVTLTTDGGSIVASVDTVTATSSDQQYVDPAVYLGARQSITGTFGSIDVTGTGNVAVLWAYNNVGDITLSVDSATAEGNHTGGVLGYSGEGDVDIAVGSITLNGTAGPNSNVAPDTVGTDSYPDGIVAYAFSGSASVEAGSAITRGLYGSAAVAIGGVNAEVAIDYAEADSEGAVTLLARSTNGGTAAIAAGTVIMNGIGSAIDALASGGIATVTVDDVTSGGRGIYADGGATSVEYGTVVTGASGVIALGDTVSVSDMGQESSISAGNNGIYAGANDSVDIAVAGSITTNGDYGSGIKAVAPGAVSIAVADVSVTGAGLEAGVRPDGYRIDQGGIVVDGEGGAGAIAIDAGTVSVEGEYRYGITARGDGPITIAADSVDLASADSVAVVARGGAGDVSITTGTITTTGASGVGIFGDSTSGNVTIVADTTRVESDGFQGQFTGDAIVGTSDTGSVSITSDYAYSAAYAGTAVLGIGANVSLVSNIAETSGDAGIAVYGAANGPGGTVSIEAATILAGGIEQRALLATSNGGLAQVTVGDVTGNAEVNTSYGLLVRGFDADVTVNGDVVTGGMAANVQSLGGMATLKVNGSVVSTLDIGASIFAQNAEVTVAQGAAIDAARAGLVFTNYSPVDPGIMFLENFGTIAGSVGVYVNPNGQGISPTVYMYNDGTITGKTTGFAVITGSGDDVLELTENAIVEGVVDLGGGDFDSLSVGFTDTAAADAVGSVAETVNVEFLSVNDGTWRAATGNSVYERVAIDEGSRLIVAQDNEFVSIIASLFELEGQLDLELTTDSEPGELTGVVVEGTGSLHLTGPATLLVDDASGLQHTGGTFVENGTLLLTDVFDGDIATSGDGTFQLGDGGTTGDFTGDLVNDGTFVFNRSDDYTLAGSFTGTGQLDKYGAGTLFFGGFYDFTGTTTVYDGVLGFAGTIDTDTELALDDGGALDLSQVDGGEAEVAELSGDGGELLLGDIVFTVSQDADTSFDGSISGTGTFVKDGSGDLKLSGDSDFSGTAEVDGGTLSVNGDFASANFVVDEGGTLGGNGTLGSTSVEGGTFAPGNSIDTITVAGDLAFTAASVFEVEANAAGEADRVDVTGMADLGGATVDVLAAEGIYAPITDYVILTAADGVSGTFGAVNSNLAFLDPSLLYTDEVVTLRLARNDIDFSAYAASANQAAVGNLIEALGYGTPLYNTTLVLDRAQAATAFATLTGEVYPAFGSVLIETADLVRRQSDDAMMRQQPGTFLWGSALQGNVDGDGGNAYADIGTNVSGLLAGVGFGSGSFSAAIGGGKTWFDPSGGQLDDAGITMIVAQAGFGGASGFVAKAGLQLGWVDADVSRSTGIGPIAASVDGEIDGTLRQYYGEIGFRAALGSFTLEPFAGFRRIELNYDNVTETGGVTALSVGALDRDVDFADIGLRLSGNGAFSPYVSGNWRKAWGDRGAGADIAFAGNTAPLAIAALPIDKDALQAGAGFTYRGSRVTASVGYEGSFSDTFDSHGVRANISIGF